MWLERRIVSFCFAAFLVIAPAWAQSVSVFSAVDVNSYHHESIPAGKMALREITAQHGWNIEFTENSAEFNAANLNRYDVVVWNNTGGKLLDDKARTSFQNFIRDGGGYVCIHMAISGDAATEVNWSWYEQLVDARFKVHPPGTPTGTLYPVDSDTA